MLKHIYLVRHGESRANATGIREGKDSPLTQKGEEQADFVAKRFENIPIEIVLSSHYKRAEQTGSRIAEKSGVPMEVIEGIHEREKPDSIRGKHINDPDVQVAMAKFEYSWMHDSSVDSGEHFSEIVERARNLAEVIKNRPEQHIVISSHGFFLKLFVAHLLLGEYLTPDMFIKKIAATMRMSNTGITYFTVDDKDKWQLYAWSDFAHLGVAL
ncbi:hypothetical protein COB52_02700 [Candidatus Kaiserbacteria bacterium]|nr:MAG: hypothetical protein COB52_02700 [Candidatus Kaiserbacteria bacterium]